MASHQGLSLSSSCPDLRPQCAQPGGVWVNRTKKDAVLAAMGGVVVGPKPPAQEAALVAWKARRKATLQGNLGTGNRVSSVIQYPCSTRDPNNMASRYKNHLSAEDRRILRVRVKGHMKSKPNYPDSVYAVEKILLQSFASSHELCSAFYCNDDFCEQLLSKAAIAVETGTYQDAPKYMNHTVNNPLWQDSFAYKTKIAAAEAVKRVASECSAVSSRS
eukprot:TRINITY_DN50537_c0_g1_i1.p1 TRINITY_DN50537_c0_g1~~TRINITY_DN50537_c0_g1_i1.p1  ORF type:complete len:218 (+),score=30.45 TRINITY_DN50537_c0_g1_i1:100-753(+)